MWAKISDWWYYNSFTVFIYILISAMIGCGLLMIFEIRNIPPRTEQIINLAEGKLINIRATGSFCIYDTELKFKNGSMLLVTYSFSRNHNLKAGSSYKIWDSSFYGKRCKELKGEMLSLKN